MKRHMWLTGVAVLLLAAAPAFALIDVQGYFRADGTLKSRMVRQDIKSGAVDAVELVKALVARDCSQAAAVVAAAVAGAPDRMADVVSAAKVACPTQSAAIDEAAKDGYAEQGRARYSLTVESGRGDQTDPTTFKELSPSQ